MKVELRKFKSYPRLSEETTAFNAEVWIDGVKAGEASNRGHGEPNAVHIRDHDLYNRFLAFVRALPPEESKYGPINMTEDYFIALLVEKADKAAWLERQGKTKVLFTLPTDKPGEYGTVKVGKAPGDREKAVAFVMKKYPNAVIVAGGVSPPAAPSTAVRRAR